MSLPQKKRYIEGVGQNSLVSLKATLFRHEKATKRNKAADDDHVATNAPLSLPHKSEGKSAPLSMVRLDADLKPKKKEKSSIGPANTGVTERNQRDVETIEHAPTEEQSFAILMKKSEIYEKMKRGEIETSGNDDILVDFEAKRWNEGSDSDNSSEDRDEPLFITSGKTGASAQKSSQPSKPKYTRTMISSDMRMHQEREEYEERIKKDEDEDARKEAEIAMVNQLHLSAEKERLRHQQQKEKKLRILQAKTKVIQAKAASLKKEPKTEEQIAGPESHTGEAHPAKE